MGLLAPIVTDVNRDGRFIRAVILSKANAGLGLGGRDIIQALEADCFWNTFLFLQMR